MYGIQEIPKGHNAAVFVSSLHAVPTRAYDRSTGGGGGGGEKRRRVNYNVQQIQAEQFNLPVKNKLGGGMEGDEDEEDLTANDLSPLEMKKANKRFEELNRENYNESGTKVDVPKGIGHTIVRDNKPSPTVKRMLVSKKTWGNFGDEIPKGQMRLIHNSGSLVVAPNQTQLKKLCTICGGVSYSSCIKCASRVCSVRCQKIHDETRCTQY